MNNLSHNAKWIFLSLTLTKSKLIKFFDYFKNTDNIFSASREDYEKLSFLKQEDIEKLCKRDFSKALEIEATCIKKNIFPITADSEYYPENLKLISNYPSVIYCKGNISNLNEKKCISVVGSRTPGNYGKNITYSLSSSLTDMGFCIVSGMADGVDSIAHKAALDKGGYTVAVLGCGADIIYPKENFYIYKNISANGMIISEYPPGTKPERFHFPERNKLIAALSVGTVVTEANIKSGSLITAELAIKYKKDLFAVPGNITSKLSQGTNELIKNGAHMIMTADDIYNFYENKYNLTNKKDKLQYDNLSENEKIILKALESEELNIDSLKEKTNISISELSTSLLIMELKEIIKKTDTDTYTLILN